MSLEFSLANMVWHEFYGKSEDDESDDGDDKSKKDQTNDKDKATMDIQQKTK